MVYCHDVGGKALNPIQPHPVRRQTARQRLQRPVGLNAVARVRLPIPDVAQAHEQTTGIAVGQRTGQSGVEGHDADERYAWRANGYSP